MSNLTSKILKFVPFLLVAGFFVISGSTNLVSSQVHVQILAQLKALESKIVPMALNLSLSFLVVYSAYLFYGSAKNGWVRMLTKVGCAPRGMGFWIMCFQAAFWLFFISIAFTTLAPTGLLKSVAVSGGFVAAIAGVVALGAKDAVGNVFWSICLHTLPKCKEGDRVKVEGVAPAEGIIEKIDFLTTRIKRQDSAQVVVITNAVLWQSTVSIGEPAPEKKKDDAPKVIVICCHGDADCEHKQGLATVPAALAAAATPPAIPQTPTIP